MLITFSGAVGSGKSTNAKKTRALLESMGLDVIYIRFRRMSWTWLFKPIHVMDASGKKHAQRPGAVQVQNEPQTLRDGTFKKLGFWRFSGYLWRMLIFRLLLAFKFSAKIVITDRFFYDNLVHYHLNRPLERLYLTILKRAMPQPQLAFCLLADECHIIERRTFYQPHYLVQLCRRYAELRTYFPELVPVSTDRFDELDRTIAQNVKQALRNVLPTLDESPALDFKIR